MEDELNLVTLKIYRYLIKIGEPVGPREVMHAVDLSSPAVAHRGLLKLVDLGLAEKDAYGRYSVKEKANFNGYLWIGKSLVPRLLVYGFFFIGLLFTEAAVLFIRLEAQENTEPYILLTIITAISAVIFLREGLQLKNRFR